MGKHQWPLKRAWRPVVLGGAVLALTAAAAGAAMTVYDPTNHGENARILQTVQKQQADISRMLGVLEKTLATVQSLREGHGDIGSIVGMIGGMMNFGGLGDVLGISRDLPGTVPELEALAKTVATADGKPPRVNFKSLQGTRAFIEEVLDPPPAANRAEVDATAGRRGALHYEAAAAALALALHNRETAASAPVRVKQLALDAATAKTTREQAHVQNTILIAILEELAAMRSLSAAHLGMIAAANYRTREIFVRPSTQAATSAPQTIDLFARPSGQ